jgi:Sec-independent protein secretion pathway component TatC
MGFGDVKFSFLMGLLLGFPVIITNALYGFLDRALVSNILVLWGGKRILKKDNSLCLF